MSGVALALTLVLPSSDQRSGCRTFMHRQQPSVTKAARYMPSHVYPYVVQTCQLQLQQLSAGWSTSFCHHSPCDGSRITRYIIWHSITRTIPLSCFECFPNLSGNLVGVVGSSCSYLQLVLTSIVISIRHTHHRLFTPPTNCFKFLFCPPERGNADISGMQAFIAQHLLGRTTCC